MVNILSKYQPLGFDCTDFHAFDQSCWSFQTGLGLATVRESFKVYLQVYLLGLLLRRKIPSTTDLKKTLRGILQSTAFLSATGFGYTVWLCILRKLTGHFTFLSLGFLPTFLSSLLSILIERSSRRPLLALYVANVATETLWNMAVSRRLVSNVRYGKIAIFALSTAVLLTYYKGGYHRDKNGKEDPTFSILRYVVGPCEEASYVSEGSQSKSEYKTIIHGIKGCHKSLACPHPSSCLYYSLQGGAKMFSLGLGIQVALTLVLKLKKIIRAPKMLFKKDTFKLAIFLGGFSGLFRAVLCILRGVTGKDSPSFAIPAGLIAGTTFKWFSETTIAMYMMWKVAQITYTIGVSKGLVPEVPFFSEFLFSLGTGVLFHAALIEPNNLRLSYWKFLHKVSGGRLACLEREPLDPWGLRTAEAMERTLQLTNTSKKMF